MASITQFTTDVSLGPQYVSYIAGFCMVMMLASFHDFISFQHIGKDLKNRVLSRRKEIEDAFSADSTGRRVARLLLPSLALLGAPLGAGIGVYLEYTRTVEVDTTHDSFIGFWNLLFSGIALIFLWIAMVLEVTMKADKKDSKFQWVMGLFRVSWMFSVVSFILSYSIIGYVWTTNAYDDWTLVFYLITGILLTLHAIYIAFVPRKGNERYFATDAFNRGYHIRPDKKDDDETKPLTGNSSSQTNTLGDRTMKDITNDSVNGFSRFPFGVQTISLYGLFPAYYVDDWFLMNFVFYILVGSLFVYADQLKAVSVFFVVGLLPYLTSAYAKGNEYFFGYFTVCLFWFYLSVYAIGLDAASTSPDPNRQLMILQAETGAAPKDYFGTTLIVSTLVLFGTTVYGLYNQFSHDERKAEFQRFTARLEQK